MTTGLATEKEPVPTVVFIGRLSANKRPEHAIRAFGMVRRQMTQAQMWVIGSGPEEVKLRRAAGPGVIFLGHVSEKEKRERLARAHVLVATSVREGWGLVVTEAAAHGTVSIGYDVPGLRDSIGASGGVLTRAKPTSLAAGIIRLLSSVADGGGPQARPAGVVPWAEVAAGILTVARASESAQILDLEPAPAVGRATGHGRRLILVRIVLAILGIALLLLGAVHAFDLSSTLVEVAFAALLAATLIGGFEGWLTRDAGRREGRAMAARRDGHRLSRAGLAIVALVSAGAAQSWFVSGRLLAGGDVSPPVGTAWLGRLFAPWAWSGSNLGGPAANETRVPFAAIYWLIHVLHGSPVLAQDIWYTALFAGAATAGFLFLQALGVGPAGSVLGALAYVFNSHVVGIGAQPLFLAAMVLLAGLPAVVLWTTSGRWATPKGVLILGTSAPFLGYVSQNPPLVFMIGALLASTPFLVAWLDGRAAARKALRTLGLGAPLLALASSYWLIPTLLQLRIDATSTLADTSSWIWAEGRATLANGFWLNNAWGWRFAEYFPYAGAYDKFPLLILKFLLPVTAFGFLALAQFSGTTYVAVRRARLGVAASAAGLFLVLLSTGTRLPGALIFDPIYRLPLGWLLREPGRFLMLGGLAYSVLFALTAEACWDRLSSLKLGTVWRTVSHRPGLRLAAVSAIGVAVFVPGFPLMTGAIAPDHRPLLPSIHVTVPEYWPAMTSYLNGSAPPGNLLVLPEDDFYQMPYTWGYYGPDKFIADLLTRHIVDPVAQGYTPAPHELMAAVRLVQKGLLAHDWSAVHRALTAIGTPLLLVRGDVNASFPGRRITPPGALDMALRKDKEMRLVRRIGKLALYALRSKMSATGSVPSYATVNTASPDLRDLSLLPAGTALITSPMRPALPAVLQVPPVAKWRLVGNELRTSVSEPGGRRYRLRLLSATGAFKRPVTPSPQRYGGRPRRTGRIRHRARRPVLRTRENTKRQAGGTPVRPGRLTARTLHRSGHVVEQLSYKLRSSLLSDGQFASGTWGPVHNCAAFPGTAGQARLSARVHPGQGPAGKPALELSARTGSACEVRSLAWRSGPLFVGIWVRNIVGAAPRICLWQAPVNACAAMAPLSPNSGRSGWYRYQTIVTPVRGTRTLSIYLYADVFTPGAVTTSEYSDVVVRRSPVLHQPVILASSEGRRLRAPALYEAAGSFSPEWIGAPGHSQVKVDGLRNGWLGPHSRIDRPRFGPSAWYLLSHIASLLAVALMLALLLSRWRGGRHRLVAKVRSVSGGRKSG